MRLLNQDSFSSFSNSFTFEGLGGKSKKAEEQIEDNIGCRAEGKDCSVKKKREEYLQSLLESSLGNIFGAQDTTEESFKALSTASQSDLEEEVTERDFSEQGGLSESLSVKERTTLWKQQSWRAQDENETMFGDIDNRHSEMKEGQRRIQRPCELVSPGSRRKFPLERKWTSTRELGNASEEFVSPTSTRKIWLERSWKAKQEIENKKVGYTSPLARKKFPLERKWTSTRELGNASEEFVSPTSTRKIWLERSWKSKQEIENERKKNETMDDLTPKTRRRIWLKRSWKSKREIEMERDKHQETNAGRKFWLSKSWKSKGELEIQLETSEVKLPVLDIIPDLEEDNETQSPGFCGFYVPPEDSEDDGWEPWCTGVKKIESSDFDDSKQDQQNKSSDWTEMIENANNSAGNEPSWANVKLRKALPKSCEEPRGEFREELSYFQDMNMIVLVSLYPSAQQQSKQRKGLAILTSLGVKPEIVDDVNLDKRNNREKLFQTSGLRSVYPQFFIVQSNGDAAFFGDYDVLEHHNGSGTLVEKLQAAFSDK